VPVALATVNRQEASISTVKIASARYLAISSTVSRYGASVVQDGP
jgi:hypothetical protein